MPIERNGRIEFGWLAALVLVCTSSAGAATGESKLDFWNQQRKGANCQNRRVTPAYWAAARAAGIEFIRLAPDAWRGERRDFLIGNCDGFDSLVAHDVHTLRGVLDDAQAAGVRVVLGMFSLPGARWRQLNGDRDDGRLWAQNGFRDQAVSFWRQLARTLRDHPAIVGYNPLNEPHPEHLFGFEGPGDPYFEEWHRLIGNNHQSLDEFNREIVAAIREVDPETPILLEGWFYATAMGLTFLEPVDDPRVLYSFHVYEPWEYTTFRVNAGRYSYPSKMPAGWNPERPAFLLRLVAEWADAHHIPPARIIASEFGVDRRVPGAAQYLTDWISLLNSRSWHWAFYSFREDGAWGGMDYELGTAPLGGAYWAAVDRGADPESLKHRGPNPLWDVLARELKH